MVSAVRPEDNMARAMSAASFEVPEGAEPPQDPRMVLFSMIEVDQQKLPYLMEMPVGHKRWDLPATTQAPEQPGDA